MDDLESTTNREALKIFRNGRNRRLRDELLGFIGSTSISVTYYVNSSSDSNIYNVKDDLPYLGIFIATTTILATTGIFDYLIRKYTIFGDKN
ncbi:MAG: hypothetical protein AABY07_07640 [Nanoarchaeota archaeon]